MKRMCFENVAGVASNYTHKNCIELQSFLLISNANDYEHILA